MKIEVCCPGCGNGYLVDEGAAGAEFVCPACSRPIPLPGTREPASPAAADPATKAEPPAATEPQEVVCPRCKLHFAPRGHQVGAAPGPRPTVLIVDEEGYFLSTAQEILSAEYDVRTATRLGEAEHILAAGGIDLLILDLGAEGGALGRSLLRGPAYKYCPVLIYTASDESEIFHERWEELRALGADDVVIKGMNVAESLKDKVGALLGRVVEDDED